MPNVSAGVRSESTCAGAGAGRAGLERLPGANIMTSTSILRSLPPPKANTEPIDRFLTPRPRIRPNLEADRISENRMSLTVGLE